MQGIRGRDRGEGEREGEGEDEGEYRWGKIAFVVLVAMDDRGRSSLGNQFQFYFVFCISRVQFRTQQPAQGITSSLWVFITALGRCY